MEYLIIFVLILLLTFIGYSLYISLKRITQLENIIFNFYKIVNFVSERIKKIDESGHFESDDEVGFFFNELKKMSQLLESNFESDESKTDIGEKFNEQN